MTDRASEAVGLERKDTVKEQSPESPVSKHFPAFTEEGSVQNGVSALSARMVKMVKYEVHTFTIHFKKKNAKYYHVTCIHNVI